MKRLLFLLLLTAGVAAAEDTKLPRATVMRSGNANVALPAGTLVKVVEQGDETVTIKVNGKVGTIPWSALDDNAPAPSRIQRSSAAAAPSAPAPTPAAPAAPSEASAKEGPRRAQTMYGKAVEKARDNASSHEKAMVQPTDEILDGK
jgi:hypothetical protein